MADEFYEYLEGENWDTKISSLLLEGETLIATFAVKSGYSNHREAFAVTTERLVIYDEYDDTAYVRSVPINRVLELLLIVRSPQKDAEREESLEIMVSGIVERSSGSSQRSCSLKFNDPSDARRAHDIVLQEMTRR